MKRNMKKPKHKMSAAEFDEEVARVFGISFVVDETIPDDESPQTQEEGTVIDLDDSSVKLLETP